MEVHIKFRATGLVLAIALVLSMVMGTGAFAAETGSNNDSGNPDSGYSDSNHDSDSGNHDSGIPAVTITSAQFDSTQTLELNSRIICDDVEVSDPNVALTAKSSDDTVIKTYLEEDPQDPGYYGLALEAWKVGTATVTLTAADGTEKSQEITVEDNGVGPQFTIDPAAAPTFSMPSGESRYITVHYESSNPDTLALPTLVPSNPDAFTVQLVNYDFDTNDYNFLVTATGKDGDSATLYAGSSDYVIPQAYSTVTIAENKSLTLDTKGTYTFNVGDSYDFVALTASATAPTAACIDGTVSIGSARKATGGYEYTMTANQVGDSLVEVTLGDETSTFLVHVNDYEQPSVTPVDSTALSVEQGRTNVYHFTIMGGGVPAFVTDPAEDGPVAVQSMVKTGTDYAVTVAATGKAAVGDTAELYVTFPDTGDDSFTVDAGTITVAAPSTQMKSDTTSNFSVPYGSSYTFRISNADSFYAGTSGVFTVQNLGRSGMDSFYKVTAVGKPGTAAGFYMSSKDEANPQKVCVVTVGQPVIKSDTTSDFSVAKGASYQYKITAPGLSSLNFTVGNGSLFQTKFIKHVGNDFYYQVTAVGTAGQGTGVYVGAPGQASTLINIVTVKNIAVTSDTPATLSLTKGKSYQFKLSVPAGVSVSSLSFGAGTSGVVTTAVVSRQGNNFFCKVTATGASGKQVGVYATLPGQSAQKVCVITVK